MVGTTVVDSAFPNQPFLLDDYIKPTDKTCPAPGVFAPHGVVKDSAGALPGGCTEDLVHRYYQEQWQIHGGQQDRYVAGSDAIGLAMGVYDTKALPIYQYLHSDGAPKYVIAVPVPPPAIQLLRGVRAGDGGSRRAPARRAGLHRRGQGRHGSGTTSRRPPVPVCPTRSAPVPGSQR